MFGGLCCHIFNKFSDEIQNCLYASICKIVPDSVDNDISILFKVDLPKTSLLFTSMHSIKEIGSFYLYLQSCWVHLQQLAWLGLRCWLEQFHEILYLLSAGLQSLSVSFLSSCKEWLPKGISVGLNLMHVSKHLSIISTLDIPRIGIHRFSSASIW